MTNLQEYVDFAHTLVDVEEIKSGKFPLPSEIVFTLSSIEHAALQTQVHDAKGLKKEDFKHQEMFTASFFGVDFTFKQKEN